MEWDAHPGALATHGDHRVETREEFPIVAASRIRVVREACPSRNDAAIVLRIGGGPGCMTSLDPPRRSRRRKRV